MTTKRIIATLPLKGQTINAGFSMVGMRHPALDPFMDITLFSMSQPTFPPHPHAGFSAVTYMLPESAGGFVNRDSLGDRSVIGPGAIHWTQAGAGMMHEEVPEHPGVICRGFQMFVKLPAALELLPPAAFHANPDAIPVVQGDGWSIRVLAGVFNDIASPLSALAYQATLLDVTIEPRAQVSITNHEGVSFWAMLMEGDVSVEQEDYAAPFGLFWDATGDTIQLSGGRHQARILVGGAKPLRELFQFGGPFALSTSERLTDAKRRYSQGAMGALGPSF
jgi:redox-sensitive bicupin YhaK (pirin superfamily)